MCHQYRWESNMHLNSDLPLIAYRYHRTCLELLSHRHSCPLQLPVAISVHWSDCQTKNSNDNNNKNDGSKS